MHICNGPLQHHKPSHCILMHLQFFKHVLQPLQHIIYSIPKHCFFAFVHSVIFKYSFIYKFLILIFSKSFKLFKKVIMQFITSPNYHHLRTSNIRFYLFFYYSYIKFLIYYRSQLLKWSNVFQKRYIISFVLLRLNSCLISL